MIKMEDEDYPSLGEQLLAGYKIQYIYISYGMPSILV